MRPGHVRRRSRTVELSVAHSVDRCTSATMAPPGSGEELPRVSSVSGGGPRSLAPSAVGSLEGGSSIGPPRGSPIHMTRLQRHPGDVELTPQNWGSAETEQTTGIKVQPDSTVFTTASVFVTA